MMMIQGARGRCGPFDMQTAHWVRSCILGFLMILLLLLLSVFAWNSHTVYHHRCQRYNLVDDDDDWEEPYEETPTKKMFTPHTGRFSISKTMAPTPEAQAIVDKALKKNKKNQEIRYPKVAKNVSFTKRPVRTESYQSQNDVEPIRVTNV